MFLCNLYAILIAGSHTALQIAYVVMFFQIATVAHTDIVTLSYTDTSQQRRQQHHCMDFTGAAGVRGDVDRVNKSLRLFSDTLEEWVECQRKWLYLENIFMAPDIQRQLPNETKLFASVDRQFKSIMRITRDRPAALPVSPCCSATLCC